MAKQMQIVSHGMMDRSGEEGRGYVCSVRSPGVWFSFTLLSRLPCDDAFSYMDLLISSLWGNEERDQEASFVQTGPQVEYFCLCHIL